MSTGVRRYLDLTIPTDLEAIAALPPPESTLASAGRRQLFDIASSFLDLWNSFVYLDTEEVVKGRSLTRNGTVTDGTHLWAVTFRALGSYYDYAVRRLISTKLPRGEILPPGIRLDPLQKFLERPLPPGAPPFQWWAKMFTATYLACLQGCYFYETMQPAPLRGPLRVFEAEAHDTAKRMAEFLQTAPLVPLQDLATRLLVSTLAYIAELYGPYKLEKGHEYGAFSTILPDELPLLAKRDGSMMKKYGSKNVETVFAQRLAVVAQSLGFYVVPARPGDRLIDLVCISSDPDDRFTALWEAKSTKRAYGLPTDDERAIEEYVVQAKRGLKTLGPLRYILIVSHSPAKSLDRKLIRLEASAGIPIRFATAQSVANLREALPGPAPMLALREAIVTGGHILDKEFWKRSFETMREEQDAHAAFVRSMFGLTPSRAPR